VVDKVVVFVSENERYEGQDPLREDREPTVGDKFSSRHGQKGIVGRLVKHHDIPFLPDGSVPDLIINPRIALPDDDWSSQNP
jgi:DNA-directed RNA polymerase beta subunit